MNTPIFTTELDPAERKRRKTAVARAETICRSLGFRQVAGRPGYWRHEHCDPGLTFELTNQNAPIESGADVIGTVVLLSVEAGRHRVLANIRKALQL